MATRHKSFWFNLGLGSRLVFTRSCECLRDNLTYYFDDMTPSEAFKHECVSSSLPGDRGGDNLGHREGTQSPTYSLPQLTPALHLQPPEPWDFHSELRFHCLTKPTSLTRKRPRTPENKRFTTKMGCRRGSVVTSFLPIWGLSPWLRV